MALSISYFIVQNVAHKNKARSINKQLNSFVTKEREQYSLPALSVSIKFPDDATIYSSTSGTTTINGKKEVSPKTLFQMGSITKSFTAAIVYQLDAEGILSVNDKLGKWLPEYKKWSNITLYQLLTHTSGVTDYIDTPGFWETIKCNPKRQWTLPELAQLAYKRPDTSPPGRGYQYTNTDYVLLGLVIEKATNRPVEDSFQRYLLANPKIGLTSTYYLPRIYPNSILSRMAHGYDNEGTFGFNKDVTTVNTSFSPTSGAIVSTPGDIVRWIDSLFNKGILPEKQLQQMLTVVNEDNGNVIDNRQLNSMLKEAQKQDKLFVNLGAGSGIGMVYLKSGGVYWMHAGGMPGYQSLFAYNPCSGVIIALAYNVQPKENYVFMSILNDIDNALLQRIPMRSNYTHGSSLPYQIERKICRLNRA